MTQGHARAIESPGEGDGRGILALMGPVRRLDLPVKYRSSKCDYLGERPPIGPREFASCAKRVMRPARRQCSMRQFVG